MDDYRKSYINLGVDKHDTFRVPLLPHCLVLSSKNDTIFFTLGFNIHEKKYILSNNDSTLEFKLLEELTEYIEKENLDYFSSGTIPCKNENVDE